MAKIKDVAIRQCNDITRKNGENRRVREGVDQWAETIWNGEEATRLVDLDQFICDPQALKPLSLYWVFKVVKFKFNTVNSGYLNRFDTSGDKDKL